MGAACGLNVTGGGGDVVVVEAGDAGDADSLGVVDAQPVEDRASPDDVGVTPNRRCDPTKPFETPVPVPGLSDANVEEGHAWISPDELTAYLILGSGDDREIMMTTRASTGSAFGPRSAVPSLASVNVEDDNVCLTSDLLTVFFSSKRAPSTDFDLWIGTRLSATAPFDGLLQIANVNSPTVDADPFVLPNGAAIYFDSNRGQISEDDDDIYVARRQDRGYGTATKVLGVNQANVRDRQPVLTADELTMIFTSKRNLPDDPGDFFIATRANVVDAFSTPVHLPGISSPNEDLATSISADGCVLYLSSDRNGSRDIFRTQRPR